MKTIIAKKDFNNNWWNLTTNEGKEVSVFVGTDKAGKLSNPTLNTALANVEIGGEVDMDIKAGKDGTKLFGWEVKAAGSGGGKSFAPADKSFQAALAAAPAASSLLALGKDQTMEKWLDTFNKIHATIMSKKSA